MITMSENKTARQQIVEAATDQIETAYQRGGMVAAADAQACKAGAHGGLWRSREHAVPADPDERAAWMRGYGKVFAWWGGAGEDVQVTSS